MLQCIQFIQRVQLNFPLPLISRPDTRHGKDSIDLRISFFNLLPDQLMETCATLEGDEGKYVRRMGVCVGGGGAGGSNRNGGK